MEIPGEISLLCRLCLANDEVNVPIFGEQSDIRQISLKISSCLPVKIAADDLLPKNICEGCSDKLELLYTFSKTSQEAEKKLLVWVEQVSVNNASEAITAVAKQIVDSTEVKEESDEGHKVNVKKSFDELVEDAEEKEPESEAPPPKRARRTAAVKAQISISQESEDEDDVDMVEPLTKVEDESEVSDSESVEPHSSFVDVPGTSADEQQPGPSGVQKDGADAPKQPVTIKQEAATSHQTVEKNFKRELSIDDGDSVGNSNLEPLQEPPKNKCNSGPVKPARVVVSKKNFTCKRCGGCFQTNSARNEHMQVIHSNVVKSDSRVTPANQFLCGQCEIPHQNFHYLSHHMLTIHKVSIQNCFKCEFCKETIYFLQTVSLHRHISEAHGVKLARRSLGKESLFKCGDCDLAFLCFNELRKHFREHDPSMRNYRRCDFHVCKNLFYTDLGKLATHYSHVHGIKLSSALNILKSAPTPNKPVLKLVSKMVIEKPVFTVGKVFSMAKDSAPVVYQKCGMCNKTFISDVALTKHIYMVHSQDFLVQQELIKVIIEKEEVGKEAVDRAIKIEPTEVRGKAVVNKRAIKEVVDLE